MKLILILIAFCGILKAPDYKSIVILQSEVINPYEAILRACIQIESSGNRFAYNPKENAYGILQVRPVRLVDYNRRTGKRYSRVDCFIPEISKEIFLYYANKAGPYDLDKIVRDWNGSGEMTFDYLKQVKARL